MRASRGSARVPSPSHDSEVVLEFHKAPSSRASHTKGRGDGEKDGGFCKMSAGELGLLLTDVQEDGRSPANVTY